MNRSMPSTGTNPRLANAQRAFDKRLDNLAKLTIETPSGRRRKKYITKVETAVYRDLIITVAQELQSRRNR